MSCPSNDHTDILLASILLVGPFDFVSLSLADRGHVVIMRCSRAIGSFSFLRSDPRKKTCFSLRHSLPYHLQRLSETNMSNIHAEVQDYYGQQLQKSEDLKTDACCSKVQVPLFLRKIIERVHPDVIAKFVSHRTELSSRVSFFAGTMAVV